MRATMRRYGTTAWIAVAVVALASGCGGSGGTGGAAPEGVEALAQFSSCDDLRDAIVADARAKIAAQAVHLRASFVPLAVDPTASPAAAPTPSPAGGASGPGDPRDFSDTNTQVPGVDEADVLETDGTHLYLLRDRDLVILDSWPPEATRVRARLAIEGAPAGMFVAGTRALVVSTVVDDGELGGGNPCHVIGPATPPVVRALDTVPCYAPFTKVTLVDLSTIDQPRVARELYLEGTYVSARRHGELARVVVQRSWGLPADVPSPWPVVYGLVPPDARDEYVTRVDAWERQAIAAVESSTLADWLPARRERVRGTLVGAPPDCADVHVPPPALAGDGATRVVSLDIRADDGPVHDTIVVGGVSSLFASGDTLVLAQPDWSRDEHDASTDRTALHVFALPPDTPETTYRASGFVPGVPLSQFAFDARDDTIRVATTVTRIDAEGFRQAASRVTVVRVDGTGLALVGATGDLAPGERIVGTRFLGTRAYLVTFRRIDPLLVVDLADPAQPRVLGEVELPGFSEYLHPLDEGHLLTIGVDAGPFGESRGVALRLFDVTDPAAPRLAHVETLPGDGWSPATENHLAFTFDARRGLLALPFSRYDPEFRSSLVLIGVDTSAGFTEEGEIDHRSLANELCPAGTPCFAATMERGVFIDDWIYSISSAGVGVNTVTDLAPVASVFLGSSSDEPPVPLPRVTPIREPIPAGT